MTLKVHIRQAAVPEVLELGGANVFLHEGKLIIGYGVAKRLAAKGDGRIQELSAKWQELVDASEIQDEVSVPGTGLIGLSSITFSSKSSAESVIIVPARTLVIQQGHSYEVVVDEDESYDKGNSPAGNFVEGLQSSAGFRASVEKAIAKISAGNLEKVVLARDLVLETVEPVELESALARLH